MKRVALVLLSAVLGLPSLAPAQEPADPSSPAAARRRSQLIVMEGILAASVQLGATQVARDIQTAPGTYLLTGNVRARGFILEGYGVFFDVDIPNLNPSLAWISQMVEQDMRAAALALEQLRQMVESAPDGASKQQAQSAIKRIEQQVTPVRMAEDPPRAGSAMTPPLGTMAAARMAEERANAHYTRTVISACLDAMIDHSKPIAMELKPDESLTVALRSTTPPLSQEMVEVLTLVLRVRGADLVDFFAGRITREELRGKVEVREF